MDDSSPPHPAPTVLTACALSGTQGQTPHMVEGQAGACLEPYQHTDVFSKIPSRQVRPFLNIPLY